MTSRRCAAAPEASVRLTLSLFFPLLCENFAEIASSTSSSQTFNTTRWLMLATHSCARSPVETPLLVIALVPFFLPSTLASSPTTCFQLSLRYLPSIPVLSNPHLCLRPTNTFPAKVGHLKKGCVSVRKGRASPLLWVVGATGGDTGLTIRRLRHGGGLRKVRGLCQAGVSSFSCLLLSPNFTRLSPFAALLCKNCPQLLISSSRYTFENPSSASDPSPLPPSLSFFLLLS